MPHCSCVKSGKTNAEPERWPVEDRHFNHSRETSEESESDCTSLVYIAIRDLRGNVRGVGGSDGPLCSGEVDARGVQAKVRNMLAYMSGVGKFVPKLALPRVFNRFEFFTHGLIFTQGHSGFG